MHDWLCLWLLCWVEEEEDVLFRKRRRTNANNPCLEILIGLLNTSFNNKSWKSFFSLALKCFSKKNFKFLWEYQLLLNLYFDCPTLWRGGGKGERGGVDPTWQSQYPDPALSTLHQWENWILIFRLFLQSELFMSVTTHEWNDLRSVIPL